MSAMLEELRELLALDLLDDRVDAAPGALVRAQNRIFDEVRRLMLEDGLFEPELGGGGSLPTSLDRDQGRA
jgi:hypothetical protein